MKTINKRFTTIYVCAKCGLMTLTHRESIKHDYGWKHIKNTNIWICHHCACHEGDSYTKEEWQEFVVENNSEIFEEVEKQYDLKDIKW